MIMIIASLATDTESLSLATETETDWLAPWADEGGAPPKSRA